MHWNVYNLEIKISLPYRAIMGMCHCFPTFEFRFTLFIHPNRYFLEQEMSKEWNSSLLTMNDGFSLSLKFWNIFENSQKVTISTELVLWPMVPNTFLCPPKASYDYTFLNQKQLSLWAMTKNPGHETKSEVKVWSPKVYVISYRTNILLWNWMDKTTAHINYGSKTEGTEWMWRLTLWSFTDYDSLGDMLHIRFYTTYLRVPDHTFSEKACKLNAYRSDLHFPLTLWGTVMFSI